MGRWLILQSFPIIVSEIAIILLPLDRLLKKDTTYWRCSTTTNVYHLLASESIFVSFFTLEELLSFSVNVVVDVAADDDDGLEMHEETVKQHDDILTRETHDQEINVRNLLLHLLLKVLLLKCHFSSFCSLRLAKTSRKMAHILRAALLLLIAASTTYRVGVLLPFLMTFRFIST